MNQKFDYDDINLIPRYSDVDSRSECDTSIKIGGYTFKNPIIPANMESVLNEQLCEKLAKEGYFYIMHRFNIDIFSFVKKMKSKKLFASISIGVNEDSYELIQKLASSKLIPEFITIDIAHGHCKKMKKMIKFVKNNLPNTYLIAGNVATIDATRDLDKWGADAIKVGIGPGCFVPTSKIVTKSGIKELKEIQVGDLVLTHTNKYQKVLKIHNHIEKDTLIKINDLPMCTTNHEFYVISKKDINIINENNINNYGYWVKASNLNKNKHLLVKL